MKQQKLAAILLATAMAFGALPASAGFISGAITMSGDFAPTGGPGLGDATGIDFLGDDFSVDSVTGDFASAGIVFGDIGFFQDFQFSPLNPAPVDPLWAILGFEFALEAVSVDFQSANFLVLSGTGTLSGVGFDDTSGTWNLTGNSAGVLFNFSAGSVAAPEPATLALIALGIIGFAVARRRRD